MQLFKFDATLNYLKYQKAASIASGIVILISLVSLGFQSLNLVSIFTGGTLIHVVYPQSVDVRVSGQAGRCRIFQSDGQKHGSSVDVEIRFATASRR